MTLLKSTSNPTDLLKYNDIATFISSDITPDNPQSYNFYIKFCVSDKRCKDRCRDRCK